MAATLSAGVSSLILKLDTPYDRVRTTDARDDLEKVRVWCSTTSGFTPSDSNKVFDALSLSVVISKITTDGTTFTALVAGTTYYVKYAFISTIDDVSATAFTISSELSAVPIVASAQTVDISGYSAFVKSSTGTFTPATATLTAVLNGITTPVYAWTITGGTLSASNTSSTVVTPSSSATSVTVTLSVTGAGLTTPIVKSIIMAIIADGIQGYSPPTFYISNYGSTFRKDISGSIYPASGIIIETGYSNFKTSPAPTFQWKKDGVDITGATSFSYTVPASDYSSSTSHIYSCTVSGLDLAGAAKSVTSSTTIPLISDGSTGPRTATGYLYYQTAVAASPGTPSASNYNFSTGQFATLTAGWGYSPISPSTTDTTLKAWASRYSVVEPSYDTATGAAAISAPSASINFDGIVTFSNNTYQTSTQVNTAVTAATANKLEAGTSLNSALALNTTVIDGGRITTGIIDAAYLNLSGKLSVGGAAGDINAGTTTISGGKITANSIDADRLSVSFLQVGDAITDINGNTSATLINGGQIQTGSINADRLSIGQTTSNDRIRMYDNRIEVWVGGNRRVVLGDLS
jgi:hypothetical protein